MAGPPVNVYLVARGHFWSCDKDGDGVHTFRVPLYPKNPMLHTNVTALCMIERKLLPIKVLHCGAVRFFSTFWPLWPWPWPDDLHIWTRPVDRGYAPHVQIWTSYIKVSKVIIWQADWNDQNYYTCHFKIGNNMLNSVAVQDNIAGRFFHCRPTVLTPLSVVILWQV